MHSVVAPHRPTVWQLLGESPGWAHQLNYTLFRRSFVACHQLSSHQLQQFRPHTKDVLNRIIRLGGIFGTLLLHQKNKWERSLVADKEQHKHNFYGGVRGRCQATEMVQKMAGPVAGRFTPTVITATGLEKGPRDAENTFIKVIK